MAPWKRSTDSPRHKVTFEPVDLEIEVSEDEIVLEGAFRQGIILAHGCQDGHCSAIGPLWHR